MIRILCVDDHPLVRKGIAAILANESDMHLAGEAGSGQEAIDAFRRVRPDVTLMDLRLPGIDGIAATKMIIAEDAVARIIALTSYCGDHEIYSALEAGVRGYLLKEMLHTDVARAIRTVYSGKRLMSPGVTERLNEHFTHDTLTDREMEVLRLASLGLTNKEIGDRLGLAVGTAKMHLQHILSKLGASDRTQAVTLALRRGIIRLDS
jgi:DNA-binding NarL/FixJ family response regulator